MVDRSKSIAGMDGMVDCTALRKMKIAAENNSVDN